jgi:thermopsin
MQSAYSAALLMAVLVLSSPAVAAGQVGTSAPLPYQMILRPGYYQTFQVDAPSNPTTVTISTSSNTSISTALMTNAQFNVYNNNGGPITAALFAQNATNVQHTSTVQEGIYYVVFYAYGQTANVSYNFQTYPISPYATVPVLAPQPTGIAAYGLYNDSGKVTSYTTTSRDEVGVADIASIQAYNASAARYNDTLSGATLQLNTILLVNEKGGLQQSYWVQDTPDFVTAASKVSWADNIWNASVSGYLSNSTVTSTDGGYAYSFYNQGAPGYYYSFQSNNMTYQLPFQLALVLSETTIPGQGVLVQMGDQVIGNGSAPAKPVNWFDNATILDSTVQSAYFFVSGNATTPDGLFYDTEFVFGGEGNGESTTFNQLSASLGLFYGSSVTESQSAFPSYYNFGGDTGEAAYHVRSSFAGNGYSTLSAGSPNYSYLGRSTGTYSLPISGTTVTASFSSQTSGGSSTSSQGKTSPGSVALPTSVIVGGLIAVVLVVALLFVVRRRGPPSAPYESAPPMQAASGVCPRCGTGMAAEAKFCPNCGAEQSADWTDQGPQGTQ